VILVDSWAWIALACEDDQYHETASEEHTRLKKKRRAYATTNFVLNEVITCLYRRQQPDHACAFLKSVFEAADRGALRLIEITADQFRRAWRMRQKYDDKPDISFVDFTSMIAMQDLDITEIFSGDAHFEHVGLGFQLRPSRST
jgi:predicted nucleic acid-binding protein